MRRPAVFHREIAALLLAFSWAMPAGALERTEPRVARGSVSASPQNIAQSQAPLSQNPVGTQRELEIAPASPANPNQTEVVPKTLPPLHQQGGAPPPLRDETLSHSLNKLLHSQRLPYVNAEVFVDTAGQPQTAVLSGRVRTEFGKQDAERKVETFLRTEKLAITNQIQVTSNPGAGPSFQASNQTAEIALPQRFFGCWQGTAFAPDTNQYLGGCPPGYPVPETTTWCFRQSGGGGFELTRQTANSPLQNFRERTELIDSDGQYHIDLSSVGSYTIPLGPVTYTDISHCDIVSNGQLLACKDGPQIFYCHGLPWHRWTGHVDMHRVSP